MKIKLAIILSAFLTIAIVSSISCKRLKKGVLEIQHKLFGSFGVETYYFTMIVDDGIYTPNVEFRYNPTSNYGTYTAYYWPDKSSSGLGYKKKCDDGMQVVFKTGKECSGKYSGENGHWPAESGASGGGTPAPTGTTTTEILNVHMTGDRKDRQYQMVNIPANVKSMEIRTKETAPNSTWNETDLFVRKGTKPTTKDDPFTSGGYTADYASLSNNREQDVVKISNPPSGDWHIMLYNYNSSYYFSNLVVTITK
ncbi:MAG: hypothetical protein SGJ10_10460 [Bacteroidota bacterium]|nr:hypothetical protein [Bacteroidota bacterium]